MKIKLFILFFIFSIAIQSQELTVFYNGEQRAGYTQSRSDNLDFEPNENDLAMIEELITSHRDELSKHTFVSVLKIDKNKSIYYPKDKILNDTLVNNISYQRNDTQHEIEIIEYSQRIPVPIVYTNFDLNRKITSRILHEKKYLVEEDLIFLDWKITDEKKKIGKYTCLKATFEPESDYVYDPPRIMEAWFTNEISSNHGPMGYSGLPGLILEVRAGAAIITMDKIIFESHPVIVEEPADGEKISKKEFNDLPSKFFNRN